ncbi:MAG: DUF4382 domain-containing protein [Saprospiraceae bacterium]|nr:DUF4382 domain-containing protein [Saprospiraceae bacterium]
MNSLKLSFRSFALLIAAIFLFVSCDDDNNSSSDGNVKFEITDAPIDDANIEGVFVTVTSVRVDGEEISNFNGKQTIDLMAYQNGKLKGLGSADLAARAYTDVELVLDFDSDQSGNAPGCYVLTDDGTKHALKSAANLSNTINVNGNFTVPEKGSTEMVLDFDIRKAITYRANSTASEYSFVTDSELNSTTRLVMKSNTGKIEGDCMTDQSQEDLRIVVYAYKKGTYSATEAQPQGTSGIRFKNAVSSAVVADNGTYTLSFLEQGDYELHFVGYEDTDADGQMELKGSLLLDLLSNALDLNDISVGAGASVSVDVEVKGILPF